MIGTFLLTLKTKHWSKCLRLIKWHKVLQKVPTGYTMQEYLAFSDVCLTPIPYFEYLKARQRLSRATHP
ncbi:Uncharacterised protein [Cronobacter sakazakii]|nr:Uncharacterised protein [Cronobacter sakazakii]